MSSKRKYSNNEITVFWRSDECVHTSICFTKLLKVFNPRRRPWINIEAADNQSIIDIVDECPTRALTFMWNDADKNDAETSPKAEKNITMINEEFLMNQQEKEATTEIKVMRNGPLVVTGDFKITDTNGQTLRPAKMVSLCRCGFSNKLPYCDGSHFKHGVRDNEED